MTIALTHYLQEVNASTTLSTANALIENGTTGSGNTNKNTSIGSGVTGWGEVYSRGTTNAWASGSSEPSASGNGWCDDATTLEGNKYASGTWTATLKLSVSVGTLTADLHYVAYQYSGGTYTLIADMVATGQSITTTPANFTLTASSVGASNTFATGDKTYYGLYFNVTANTTGGAVIRCYQSSSATQGYTSAQVVTPGYSSTTTSTRTITPVVAALQGTSTRTITPVTAALQGTSTRTITPVTAALQGTSTRTITPVVAALSGGTVRTITGVTAALQATNTRTISPVATALQGTSTRTISSVVAALTFTRTRTITPVVAALQGTSTRTISPVVAALSAPIVRTISNVTAALTLTSTRTISPVAASLYLPQMFYASNVSVTTGGLTLSNYLALQAGGTETSVAVTMPSSGSGYVELLSEGGTSSSTPALPAPTGNGWSVSLSGFTILAGSWNSIFTLKKSGTAMSGASLLVRWYRRTMDGTYFPIGTSMLSGQTFNTTKTVYTTPTSTVNLPWQFIAGDTLYIDAFVLNGASAWASDVFTVYVSNSSTQGVMNDGVTLAPEMISTPPGLNCLIGTSNFQNPGGGLPVKNESFTLADALDQRSILTLTGEDSTGTLGFVRGQPVVFSDHDQGLLYTGAVNSDKMTRPAAGPASAQLEHQLTFMDHHYEVDKRANTTNYLNWTAGDMVADFVQQTLSQEGITGAFALESDYTPTTFGQGTLSGTVATNTTTPFSYAPNTASPPITSNTGDLELTRAGTAFSLTETTTSDFSSGTLTNMVAANNALTPATQSAIRVVATVPGVGAQNSQFSGMQGNIPTLISSSAYVKFWSGSRSIGSNDTLNYDIWIQSTSPAYWAGVDLTLSDGTTLTGLAIYPYNSQAQIWNFTNFFDNAYLSADPTTDLTTFAQDTWFTRSIPLSSISGKTITSVSVFVVGNPAGTYTVYIKNCYLGSAPASPFFSTTATQTNVNPPLITTQGQYVTSLVSCSVEQVYLPTASYRISPAHSLNSVGLVQHSRISWTTTNPILGPDVSPGFPGAATSAGSTLIFCSYDGVSWLPCIQNQPLPGLPAGSNVSGVSLYLREQFQCGPDPTALPSLLDVTISVTSAAQQSTSDLTATYGTSTEWNSGTQANTSTTTAGQLVPTSTITRNWNDNQITNQTFFYDNSASQSASGGQYQVTANYSSSKDSIAISRLDFIGTVADFTLDVDVSNSDAGASTMMIWYRTTYWGGNAGRWTAGYSLEWSPSQMTLYKGVNGPSGSVTLISHTSGLSFGSQTYHLRIVVRGSHHVIYVNNSTTPYFDDIDSTYISGGIGLGGYSSGSSAVFTFDNLSVQTLENSAGIWTSPSLSLSSLGTCGNTQVCWSELSASGKAQTTAIVQTSLDGGNTWQPCQNGATVPTASIPGLTPGTNVSGKSLLIQMALNGTTPLNLPLIYGLTARVCGSYGTVTGTRVSPPLSLSPVGYVASSNVMWNANTPTNTSVTVATSQDGSTWTNVPNNGAGASLSYWTNQPTATQDSFSSNTLSNYTNTNKSGGSPATVTYDTANSRLILSGGSSGLYLNTSLSAGDVDLLVDMDQSDAGGLVWREVSTSNYYALGVYDASSSGGYTNQLRLYKITSGTRTLLGSASSITFTRGTFHRVRVTMQGGLINVYFDGTCVQSYLDSSPLSAGGCGLCNDGGTSRYYQLWIQPLGTNLSGQVLYTKVTMSTSDPAQMPQLFTLVACVRGSSIATGATVPQLHPITVPFAVYYSTEMDSLVRASGDYYWYIDRWKRLFFAPRLARPGAFPVQSVLDPAGASGYLLYQPQVTVQSAADLFRNKQIVTDVTVLVTPPAETKVADGSTTSWQMGYPLYSAPTITINGQNATVGVQGIDAGRQFYWQPGSASISYDSSLPKLPAGTILTFTYVGQSTGNVLLNNSSSQSAQAAIELNSGIVAEIESALSATTRGMTTAQATTFGNGLLSRYGNTGTIELVGTTLYPGLQPGTVIPLFLPEMMATWDAQLPIVKLTTTGFQGPTGPVYLYSIDATNGPNLSQWQRVWY